MPRHLTVAAAQLGPIGRAEPRSAIVGRLIALLEAAKRAGVELAVFPEMALTTFFPRWHLEAGAELDGFFEKSMPGPETQPLFEAAARLGVGFYLGYCEETSRSARFNSSILVDRTGTILGKYRKVHLPGNAVYDPELGLNHLEPYYFRPGDLGFPVYEAFGTKIGMLICNDRRWPEPYRVMGLQGVELVCLGYNSPAHLPDYPLGLDGLRVLHHQLPMQAGAHQNGCWVVATAKAGVEEGCYMMGHSSIISPTGEVVAVSNGLGDELLPYRIDLDKTGDYKDFFDFETYRRPDAYGLVVERKAAGGLIGRPADAEPD